MSSQPEPQQLDAGDDAELLLASLLDQPETEWAAGLEAACRQRPDLANDLRERFSYLQWLAAMDAHGSDRAPSEHGA